MLQETYVGETWKREVHTSIYIYIHIYVTCAWRYLYGKGIWILPIDGNRRYHGLDNCRTIEFPTNLHGQDHWTRRPWHKRINSIVFFFLFPFILVRFRFSDIPVVARDLIQCICTLLYWSKLGFDGLDNYWILILTLN